MSRYNISNLFPFTRVKITEISTNHDGSLTLVKIQPDKRFQPICSGCHKPVKKIHSTETRALDDLPMCGSKVTIYFTSRKVQCKQCGIRVEHFDFVEPYAHVTNRYALEVHDLCQKMTITDAAKYSKLSWHQVRRIDKKELSKKYSNIPTTDLKIMCIDEISIKKHHNYLTIFANYSTGQVKGVVENRDYLSVSNYLKNLPLQTREQIEAVAMDMWDPYIKAFKEWCPHINIVFDCFHVVSAFGKVIDKIRAEQFKKADVDMKNLMKHSRYLLLKNPENLSEKERPRLKQILENNQLLSSVYVLKDYLKKLWQYKYQKSALSFLNYWCKLAIETGHKDLIKFSEMLKNHSYGIINHCKYPIHNGKLEGINNKIKVLKRKAYGYVDIEYFALKIIQITTN